MHTEFNLQIITLRRTRIMDGEKVIVGGVEIDTKKAQLMLSKIIVREKTNIKTKQLNDLEMIKKIKKMIEEEVEGY